MHNLRGRTVDHSIPFHDFDVLNFVLLGSKSGRYGGPFETSTAQVKLVTKQSGLLFAGYFKGDAPNSQVPAFFVKVRHLIGLKSFFDVGSLKILIWCWKMSKNKVAHISFARGITPFFVAFICLARKSRTILQTHGMLTSRTSLLIKVIDFFITKPIVRRSHCIIALTDIERSSLSTWCPDIENKIKIIANPAQISEPAQYIQPKQGTALFAARLHPRKRALDFGLAAAFASDRGFSETYLLLGPDEGDLESVISATMGLPNFKYLGATDSSGALDEIRKCAVFVLASENEPWGNALVSALVLGRPVVITQSSHLADVVAKFKAGIVVPDKSPEDISRAIHDICEPSNYILYSGNALKLSREMFIPSSVKQKLERLYDMELSVLDRKEEVEE